MKKNFKKNFGNRVKHHRELLNYSQEHLAELIGMSSNTISYIERGKNTISMAKLPILCSALQIEPYQLFVDTDNNENSDTISKINNILKIATPRQTSIIYNLICNVMDL